MKKVIVISSLIIGTIITGCSSKEDSITPNTKQVKNTSKVVATYRKTGGPPNYNCFGSNGNCLPDVIVIGNKYIETLSLISAINNNNILSYFSGTTWHDILPELNDPSNEDVLDNILSGTYDVRYLEYSDKYIIYTGLAGSVYSPEDAELTFPLIK